MKKNVMHEPLEWIKSELIFLPESGVITSNKPVGDFLLPFQEDIITDALDSKGNTKNNIFLGYSRKIGKSMIFSWIYLYLLENKQGYGALNMASTFSQSAFIFEPISNQIQLNEKLNRQNQYKLTNQKIFNRITRSSIQRIFASHTSNLGFQNISSVAIDELCVYRDRRNLTSILSGLALSQSKPLLLCATNPPEDDQHWSIQYIKNLRAKKSWKFHEFIAPQKSDIFKKRTWAKANPFVKEYMRSKSPVFKQVMNYYKEEARSAKESKESEIDFRRLQLGQFVSIDAYKFIDTKNIGIAPSSVLKDKNLRAAIGADIAKTNDFCSFCLTLYDEDTDTFYLKPFQFLANVDNRRPTQAHQFKLWNKENHITLFNEPSINKTAVIETLKKFLEKNNIKTECTAFDPAQSADYLDHFYNPVLYRGSAFNMTGAIRHAEAAGANKKIFLIGEDNHCTRWMFKCAIVNQKSKN